MIYLDKNKIILITISIYLNIAPISFSQTDSTKAEENILQFNPSFHGLQIDATVFLLMYEIGGQLDYDLFHTNNKNICFGTRMSIEHYYLLDFGGTKLGSPFTNYNLYLRLSRAKDYLSVGVFGGVTYYKTNDPSYLPNKYLFRAGFEVKLGNIVGLVLKGSTSLIENSSFIGIGISLGYAHDL